MKDSANIEKSYDTFGNAIDPAVGYARGSILCSNKEEARRLEHCKRITSDRVAAQGFDSIGIFTGNKRQSPLEISDVESFGDEWIGTSVLEETFRAAVLHHLGGRQDDDAFLFNRTTAGIICAISALSESTPVVSIVPRNSRSHASVQRGCLNARVRHIEVAIDQPWGHILRRVVPRLVFISAVTSRLDYLSDTEINEVSELAHSLGAIVFLDDAYGARVRPAIYGGAASLKLGADIAITNGDKAGLHGPRAGILGGRRDLVASISCRALEWGMEGRASVRVAALRALQRYSHKEFSSEATLGQELNNEMLPRFPPGLVVPTPLGPLFSEDCLLDYMRKKRGMPIRELTIVPCEATTALGVILLRDYGILTINTHGQPGASVTLRLKPTDEAIANVGGMQRVADAVEEAILHISRNLDNTQFVSQLILGI